MGKTIERPPRTMMEVYQTLPEGTMAELIENQICMSPSPVSQHQQLLNKINVKLYQLLQEQGAQVLPAPMDVYLDETSNAVQPDIIVVLKENLSIIHENGHIHGVPDLLVEVLSPGNKDHDRVTKKALYEKFGVREYWIADPDNFKLTGYGLSGKTYEKIHEQSGTLNSPLLGLKFKL